MTRPALPTFRIPPQTHIPPASPASAPQVTPASPALSVMTDLTLVRAATVDPDMTLPGAEQSMIHQGVRLLFVVKGLPGVEGLVTSTDLHGEHALRVVQQRGIRYEEVRVAEVMTALSDIDAVDFDALRTATVADVIATFKAFGRKHLLVVEGLRAGAQARVRGVFSQAQLERQLGHAIGATEIASSFAEIQRALG